MVGLGRYWQKLSGRSLLICEIVSFFFKDFFLDETAPLSKAMLHLHVCVWSFCTLFNNDAEQNIYFMTIIEVLIYFNCYQVVVEVETVTNFDSTE